MVPVDYRKPYDVREVVARIVDGSDFATSNRGYGAATVCLQASDLRPCRCGIIGNNGPIDPDGATKATQFFQLCDQAGQPADLSQQHHRLHGRHRSTSRPA